MRFIGFIEAGERAPRIGRFFPEASGVNVAVLTDAESFYADLPLWTERAKSARADRRSSELLLAPAVAPSARVLCVGLNYQAHAAESGMQTPPHPMLFARWTASLAVDGATIPVPRGEPGLDWEVELGAIVGARLIDADEDQARAAVFGYCTFNDVSARTAQFHSTQFTVGKNADRSGPMGAVVTADEVRDPAEGLRLTTRVNGAVMQDGSTKDMIFGVPRILSYLSQTFTLNPGDVVATGTPSGIGVSRKPPVFVVPGDVMEVEVEGLGVVRNTIVDHRGRG